MIFWITLIAFVVFLMLAIIFADSWDFNWIGMFSAVLTLVSGIAAAIMLIVIIVNNVGVEAKIEVSKQRYDSLVYQAENNLYENDNDLGKKELANQIQKWNEDLSSEKALQNDFWVGIFIPDIYDEFEFIPISVLGSE